MVMSWPGSPNGGNGTIRTINPIHDNGDGGDPMETMLIHWQPVVTLAQLAKMVPVD